MSKNSTARFSSDGDADSNVTEVLPNSRSRSSSYRNRKDLEGGPYGDSPSDRTEQAYKNCFFYMIEENGNSTNTSDRSERNQDLYSLRNDYLEKLNIVRRRLNLIEINDDHSNSCRIRCTITELPQEGSPEDSQNISRNLEKEETSRESSGGLSESFEIKTIHPFSIGYNIDSQSINNLLELEYNPPKKKSCFRLRTPKFPSSSESNIPYHTKVSLHEDIFKKPNDTESKGATAQTVFEDFHEKFTVTKWTQCSDQEAECSVNRSEIEENVNLFPTVIVRTDSSSEPSARSFGAPVESKENQTKIAEEYPLNYIEEASLESYNTVTTSITILEDTATGKKRRRRRPGARNDRAPKAGLNLWKKTRSETSGLADGDFLGQKVSENRGLRFKQDITQFLTYRKEKRRAKSSPIKRKYSVPFGPIVINGYEREQNLDHKFYLFNSSSFSDEDKYLRGPCGRTWETTSSSERRETFWASLISCFRPIIKFIKKR